MKKWAGFLSVLLISTVLIGCAGGGIGGKNKPPIIDSVVPAEITTGVEPGGLVMFSVAISDPDGDKLGYIWDHAGGGEFTAKDKAAATWKAPDEAVTAIVNVTVSDGKGGTVSHSWTIEVSEEIGLGNHPPIIESFEPALETVEVELGELVEFSVTCYDHDGDELEYIWECTGLRRFVTPTSRASVKWKAPYWEGQVTVKVTVSDGKGRAVSRRWTVDVRA